MRHATPSMTLMAILSATTTTPRGIWSKSITPTAHTKRGITIIQRRISSTLTLTATARHGRIRYTITARCITPWTRWETRSPTCIRPVRRRSPVTPQRLGRDHHRRPRTPDEVRILRARRRPQKWLSEEDHPRLRRTERLRRIVRIRRERPPTKVHPRQPSRSRLPSRSSSADSWKSGSSSRRSTLPPVCSPAASWSPSSPTTPAATSV